jgi:hypothetical protein
MTEFTMSGQLKNSLGGASALIMLGIAALFCGAKWLAVLIPAALLVYSSVRHSYKGKRSV